jgi:serine O-acetyltransferase
MTGKRKPKEQDFMRLLSKLTSTYAKLGGINHIDGKNLPSRQAIMEIFNLFLKIIFPGYFDKKEVTQSNINFYAGDLLDTIYKRLSKETFKAICYNCNEKTKNCSTEVCEKQACEICYHLLSQLPKIRELLKMDIQAAFDGDPAAASNEEIIVSYPFVIAITAHRIAHELFVHDVPLIPRIFNEYAHVITGIDIHPGATIGRSFFIDHGTGVVIGETAEIGNNVKIYQGVTLGALSIKMDKKGRAIKGKKRHPTIKDKVTIYAGATILGGETVIGENSVIGGNVWLTESVQKNTTVTHAKKELKFIKLERRENNKKIAEKKIHKLLLK